MDKIRQFINLVSENGNLQKKYFCDIDCKVTDRQADALNNIIEFYEKEGYALDFQAESYLMFVNDTLEETKFFVENGHYRYAQFNEVADNVYFNHEYMIKYMVGLGLSIYLWNQHRDTIALFQRFIENYQGDNYLEIGPGHGEFFLKAVEMGKMKHYTAVDISETSIGLTRRYIEHSYKGNSKDVKYLCNDFVNTDFEKKFDVITMCEVLEHVEDPKALLLKMKSCFTGRGFCFLSVPINAPTKDHIYLFRDPQEVLALVWEVGLTVIEYRCFCANNRTLEKALKNREAILMALVLK